MIVSMMIMMIVSMMTLSMMILSMMMIFHTVNDDIVSKVTCIDDIRSFLV